MQTDWRVRLDGVLFWSSNWPTWLRYGVTILTVCSVGFAWHYLNTKSPYLLFYPTVLFCAVVFDRGSGFVATITAAIFTATVMLPSFSAEAFTPIDGLTFPLFVLVCLSIAAITETLRTRIKELEFSEQEAVKLASDRRLLMKELAHRTRNDLANVVTLLNLQAANAHAEAREDLRAAAEKVQTIARVHRQLEITDRRVVVDSKEFLDGLCSDLQATRLDEKGIGLFRDIESHPLPLQKAVPLGLIVNELITNAAKHAFPKYRTGRIDVSFKRDGAIYVLCIQDDGVGGSETAQPGTGSQLLRLLAAQVGTYEAGAGSQGVGSRFVVKFQGRAPKTLSSDSRAHEGPG